MYLFVLGYIILGVFVFFPRILHTRNQNTDNVRWYSIWVSNNGHDSPECLRNSSLSCQHLDYVFEGTRNQSSTAVYVESGLYYLKKSYSFYRVNRFAIIGLSKGEDEVVIQCHKYAGLAFINSSEITLRNVVLSSCGAIQNSTSFHYWKFLMGVFLVNCIDLNIDRVWINNSPGIGMQLYDVTGVVNISNSHFAYNGGPNDLHRTFPGCGGLYFEFTFMNGLYPFREPTEHIYQENGVFHFFNVTFEGNGAYVVAKPVNPGGNDHNAIGRGGGASFFIKGSARNNIFIFENCTFENNTAEWGAGLFVEFQDNTRANSFIFLSCNFSHNQAKIGGGAMRVGFVTSKLNVRWVPNLVKFTLCHFENNQAILGGGVSLYGTTKGSYSFFSDQSFVNMTHCVIKGNRATLGSAFCLALWNINKYLFGSGETLKVFIENSVIENNTIIFTEDKKVTGTGAMYSQGIPILLNNTRIVLNTGSALVLDNAYVFVFGDVSFIKNKGQRGGAMSLYGSGKVFVADKANLSFIENECFVQGGAIYVRSPGPQLVAFKTTELKLHGCFFQFVNASNSNVSFYGNKGPTTSSGYSVYATTLQFCRCDNEGRVNNSALQTEVFHYFYPNQTKSDRKYEITTDAVNIEVDANDWSTTTDKTFSPMVKLTDEKLNSVFGVIKIQLSPKSKVKLHPSSTFFLAKDVIHSLRVIAKPKARYNVKLETVGSQLAFNNVPNAEVKMCEPGFYWNGVQNSCDCDNKRVGVSRCHHEEQSLYLLKGFWGGYAQSSGTFVIVPCPKNYCKYNNTTSAASDEFLFQMDKQCKGNRENQLCGMCKNGFSLKLGQDKCSSTCNPQSLKWIGYLFAILAFLTLLVFFIILINFDPFTAYLNAWLYSYQVLLILIPGYISFPPFLTFIINLAHIQIIGFASLCMWSGMDDLQKLAFNYLLPFYVFFCLYILKKIVLKWPNNFFTRRFTQVSLARAFCTLFVLSYSTVVNISLKILYPVKIGDDHFVYYQGHVKYFSSYHAGFAALALFLVVFVGLFFPIVLIFRRWFQFLDNGLKRLLLDNLQRCYRDGYKWCAGFYFVCRFVLLVISHYVPRGALQISLLNSACCISLAVFVLCRPYRDDGGTIVPYKILNISDAVLLCNLCVISSFGGGASGIYGNYYHSAFKIIVSILSYVPLVFFLGLLACFLRHRYRNRARHVEIS